MLRPVLAALFVVSLATVAAAQEASPAPAPRAAALPAPGDAAPAVELAHVPVDLSLVPPISINGDRAALNHLSIGLAAARSARLEGLALSPLHWTDGETDGVQASWVAAVSGGKVRGVQLGWVTVAPDIDGVQATSIVSLAKGDVAGVQASSVTAIAVGDVAGVQASSVTAIAVGDVAGVQASGVFNWADRIEGVQASTVNYAHAASGLQYALVNIGGAVKGAQIGLVNIADTVDGAQVGLFNYAKSADASVGMLSWVTEGTHDVELYATEFSALNAGVRLGGKRVYGLLVGGVQPVEQDDVGEVRWTMGAGVGTRFDLSERVRLDVDVLAQNVQYGEVYDTDDAENVLGSLRATVAYRATPWLSAFAGPTLSVYAGKDENKNIDLGKDVDLWGEGQAWLGFAAGVRL